MSTPPILQLLTSGINEQYLSTTYHEEVLKRLKHALKDLYLKQLSSHGRRPHTLITPNVRFGSKTDYAVQNGMSASDID